MTITPITYGSTKGHYNILNNTRQSKISSISIVYYHIVCNAICSVDHQYMHDIDTNTPNAKIVWLAYPRGTIMPWWLIWTQSTLDWPIPCDKCRTIVGLQHLLLGVNNTEFMALNIFAREINIWSVNSARATSKVFDLLKHVLEKVSKFCGRKWSISQRRFETPAFGSIPNALPHELWGAEVSHPMFVNTGPDDFIC